MASESTATPQYVQIGYRDLVRRNGRFRLLWFGQIVSLLGDWFNLIASAALIAELTSSGVAVGGLFVVRMLAPFLVSPVAGVVADRYNRKHILIASDLIRAATVCGFLLVRDPQHIWLLYTLTAIQLGVGGFFFPARNAILPDLVTPGELGAANAISSTTWSVMLALGAALGGLVAGAWGNYTAFVIDALTFVASAGFISRIAYRATLEHRPSDKSVRGALVQYLEGLRYLRHHVDILLIALQKAAIALLVSGGFQVIQVAIADQVFVIGKGGGIGLGLMFGVAGIGTGIGPILARHFTGDRDRPLRVAISVGYVTAGLGVALTAPLFSFGSVLLGTLLRGVGSGIIWVFSTQLLLQLVPASVRGRVFSTEFAMFSLMSAAGAAAAGAALDSPLGISTTLLWMAGLTLLPAALWTWWLASGRRRTAFQEREEPAR